MPRQECLACKAFEAEASAFPFLPPRHPQARVSTLNEEVTSLVSWKKQ